MSDRTPLPASSPVWRHRAKVLKALGHPTRLFLVDRIGHGEICVCQLAALVDADLSTVSRHLALLREAGILADERRGAQVFYRLVAPAALDLLGGADRVACAAAARDAAALSDVAVGEAAGSPGSAAPAEAVRRASPLEARS
jgi:DNA-binding transcriptional ArsR family regulator